MSSPRRAVAVLNCPSGHTAARRTRSPREQLRAKNGPSRGFIEDYHGMLEEKFLFPELERQRNIEHRTFGKDGFADTVDKAVQPEHHVGIQSLDAYTPGEPAQVSR